MWTLLANFIFLVFYYIYKKKEKCFSYWSEKGIKGPKPTSILGNIQETVEPRNFSFLTFSAKLYDDYKNEKVVGIYQGFSPTLVVRDPEIIKTIVIKDSSIFNDKGFAFSKNLTSIFLSSNPPGHSGNNDDWQTMRQHLTKEFTTKNLKGMMPILNENVEKYMTYLNKIVKNGPTASKMRELNVKFNINAISAAGFGINFDIYNKEISEIEKNIDYYVINNLLEFYGYYIAKTLIPNVIIDKVFPYIFSNKYRRYFKRLVTQCIQQRQDNTKIGNDIFENLISQDTLKNINNGILEIDVTRITFETIFFITAGSETSANTMTYLLYELALNPAIQERCHIEIDAVMKQHDNILDYETLTNELRFLDMVIDETLRKYPVAGLLLRQASTDYTIEDINLTIQKGTKIWVPVLGLQMDEKYFPEPEKFYPERFLPENRKTLKDYYYPFGGGPRICIAMRFAKLQVLLGVAHFLHRFQVRTCEKTNKSLKFDVRYITLVPENDIWLNIEKRNKN